MSSFTRIHPSHTVTTRVVAWMLAAALLMVAEPSGQRPARAEIAKPVVHVFLQLDAKSSAVEKALRERLPDFTVTVFGRYRDFEDALATHKPDVVLTIPPVLAQYGQKATLEGLREGKSSEHYALASVSQSPNVPVSGQTIGVVDLLGRDGTQQLLAKLLQASDFKVKRVAKVEDLLPLLEFSAANAVVLPSIMLKRLVERTRLPIKSRELSDTVGLPVVAAINPGVRELTVKSFQKLDGPTKGLLGVESWSVR